jgi:hypothetical protein
LFRIYKKLMCGTLRRARKDHNFASRSPPECASNSDLRGQRALHGEDMDGIDLLRGTNAAESRDQVLTRLAVEIRAKVSSSTADAIHAGHKLLEAKALLHHGEWLPWLGDRVEMSERVAQYHMQLAQARDTKRISDLPIRAALEVVRAQKKAKALARPTIPLITHKGVEVPYPRPTGPALFNLTNEHIGWAAHSWNPVTGCIHGCEYCYAREIALSPTMRAHFPAGFDPVFHPERLAAPGNTKFPADCDDPCKQRVFVGSMTDLFGRWVPREWGLSRCCKQRAPTHCGRICF